MKLIPLTQGKFAQVDDEDYEWLNQWKWYAKRFSEDIYYAARNLSYEKGKRKTILMQRVIMNTPDGLDTDHKDRDGLNNQRYNLRVCTHIENMQNQRLRNTNKSNYKGVYWYKTRSKWAVQVSINGIQKTLGYFDTAEEAAKAYDKAAKEYHGEYANLNFE